MNGERDQGSRAVLRKEALVWKKRRRRSLALGAGSF
jgi:hypothetical protein